MVFVVKSTKSIETTNEAGGRRKGFSSQGQNITTSAVNEAMIPITRTPLTAPINRWLQLKYKNQIHHRGSKELRKSFKWQSTGHQEL